MRLRVTKEQIKSKTEEALAGLLAERARRAAPLQEEMNRRQAAWEARGSIYKFFHENPATCMFRGYELALAQSLGEQSERRLRRILKAVEMNVESIELEDDDVKALSWAD